MSSQPYTLVLLLPRRRLQAAAVAWIVYCTITQLALATTMHCMHTLKNSVSITEFWSMWSGWKFTNPPIHR